MNRRDSLKYICKSLGLVASLTQVNHSWAAAALLAKPYRFKLLTDSQQHLIIELINIILPRTNFFGGNDLHLVRFIDNILSETESKIEQQAFSRGAGYIAQQLSEINSTRLVRAYFDIPPQQQQQIFTEQELPIEQITIHDPNKYYSYRFLLKVRQLAMIGFYYAEETAKEILNYAPIPKDYFPCTLLQQTGKHKGKSWAE